MKNHDGNNANNHSTYVVLSTGKRFDDWQAFIAYDVHNGCVSRYRAIQLKDFNKNVIEIGDVLHGTEYTSIGGLSPEYPRTLRSVKFLGNQNRRQIGRLFSKIKACHTTVETTFDDVLKLSCIEEQYLIVHFKGTEIKTHKGKYRHKDQIKMKDKFIDILCDCSKYVGATFHGYVLMRLKRLHGDKIKYEAVEFFGQYKSSMNVGTHEHKATGVNNDDTMMEGIHNENDEERGYIEALTQEYYSSEPNDEFRNNGYHNRNEYIDAEENYWEVEIMESGLKDHSIIEDYDSSDYQYFERCPLEDYSIEQLTVEELGAIDIYDSGKTNDEEIEELIRLIGDNQVYRVYDYENPLFAFDYNKVTPRELIIDNPQSREKLRLYLQRVLVRLNWRNRIESMDCQRKEERQSQNSQAISVTRRPRADRV